MKKLVVRFAIIALFIFTSFIVTWFMPGTYPHDLAALVNKKEMLAAAKKPKIIFIGGSSILSLKSDQIARHFQRPVVNMGLWGGLSTRVNLNEIKPFVGSGDIIVVTCEYATMLDPRYVEYIRDNIEAKKFFLLMSPSPHIIDYIAKGEYRTVWNILFDLCQMKSKSLIQNICTFNLARLSSRGYIYYAEEFDHYGSRTNPFKVVRPLDATGKDFTWPVVALHSLVNEPMRYLIGSADYSFLNDFHDFAVSKNAKMLFYFSHFPTEEFSANEPYIRRYYTELAQSARYPILNNPDSFTFPRDHFADTIYHLNELGEQKRSEMIIQFIAKYIQ